MIIHDGNPLRMDLSDKQGKLPSQRSNGKHKPPHSQISGTSITTQQL